MGVAWDEDEERFVIVVDELPDDSDEPPAVARFRLTAAQVAASSPTPRELVGQGLPLCPLLRPPDGPRTGTPAPRTNGHHRPSTWSR